MRHLHLRWMIQRDVPGLTAFAPDWPADRLLETLRDRTCIGMVADRGDDVQGFILYQLHATHLRLLGFAVRPDARRQGVGRALVDKLLFKVASHGRRSCVATVPETNLTALLFLRAMGFLATELQRGIYPDGSDAVRLTGFPSDEHRARFGSYGALAGNRY